MTKIWKGKRFISLVLSLALLVSMLPPLALPANSVELPNTSTDTIEQAEFEPNIGVYGAMIGAAAEPNWEEYRYLVISDDPTIAMVDGQELVATDAWGIPLVVEDVHWVAEDTSLWLKVAAAEGYTLPEQLQQYPWVFQNYTDVYGDAVLEAEFPDSLLLTLPNKGQMDMATGVTVSGADLPDDAELSVSVPTIGGEPIPGVFDIKVYDEFGNEWQPIDEGKTVTISIPVEGDYATVTHLVDYAGAIQEGLTFESVEGADEETLVLLKPAIDAYEEVYGNRNYIALEITENIEIVNGVATVTTNSFSIYSAEGTEINQGALFINIGEGSDNGQVTGFAAATQVNGVWDNGVYYVPTTGGGVPNPGKIRIQAAWQAVAEENNYPGVTWGDVSTSAKITINIISADGSIRLLSDKVTMDTGRTGEIWDGGYRRGIALYDVNITGAQSSDRYYVTVDDGQGNIAMIQFVVADLGTPYKMYFTDPNGVLDEVPKEIEYRHADTVEIPAAIAKEGYEFSHWILREPAGQWKDIQYYPGNKFQHQIGEVFFIPQVIPKYKYEIEFVTDVKANGIPEDMATGWLSDSTHTAEWDTTPTAVDEHYEFMGWSVSTGGTLTENDQQLIVTGTPAGTVEVTLTAVWQHKDDKQYTVKHYYETLASGVYELVEVETLYGIEGKDTAAKANNPAGFTAPTTVTQAVITGDTTAVEIYYTRNTYNVTWYVDGTETSAVYKYGETITLPTTPTKTGYVFDRWDGYTNGMTMPANDVKFTALWNLKTLAIYFESNGGTAVAPIEQPYLSTVQEPTPPTKTGYTFAGWYTDSALTQKYTFTTMPANSITLYAKWNVNSYSVEYNTNSSITIDGFGTVQTVEYNASATILSGTPVWEGHIFLGWMCDIDGCTICSSRTYHDPDTSFIMPAKDVTLTAQWEEKTYAIHYELGLTTDRLQNEAAFATDQEKKHGTEINLYTTVPAAVGAQFVGWAIAKDGEVVYQPGAQYTTDAAVTLYAVWDPVPYDLNYSAVGLPSGTSVTFPTQQGYYGDEFEVQTPDVAGYRITNIAVDGNNVPEGYVIKLVDRDVEVVITYEPISYEITFNTNGGDQIDKKPYTIKSADALPTPSRTGYTFDGWKVTSPGGSWLLDDEFNAGTNLTGKYGDVTLTAQWTIVQYTITYNLNGGTNHPDSETYTIEDKITLKTPVREGYNFTGWKVTTSMGTWVANDVHQANTMPEKQYGDVTLTAQWTEIQVEIKYEVIGPDGCGTVTPASQTVGQATGAPSSTATASSNAYKFVGWYSDAACTVRVSANAKLTPEKVDGLYEAATYYAKFEYNLTSLTITVANSAAVDNNQGFIFEIKTKTGADAVNVTVVVLNNGTVKIEGLTIGNTYTITLKNQWSWRYENVSREITLTPGVQNEVTVTVTRKETKWLDSNGYSIKRG